MIGTISENEAAILKCLAVGLVIDGASRFVNFAVLFYKSGLL